MSSYEISLSKINVPGTHPRCDNHWKIVMYAFLIPAPALVFKTSTNMALQLKSQTTKKYWFPLDDTYRNLPVKSAYALFVVLYGASVTYISSDLFFAVELVDSKYCHSWCRWPKVVAIEVSRYFVTFSYVKPGNVRKNSCHGSSSDTTANKINPYYLIG